MRASAGFTSPCRCRHQFRPFSVWQHNSMCSCRLCVYVMFISALAVYNPIHISLIRWKIILVCENNYNNNSSNNASNILKRESKRTHIETSQQNAKRADVNLFAYTYIAYFYYRIFKVSQYQYISGLWWLCFQKYRPNKVVAQFV